MKLYKIDAISPVLPAARYTVGVLFVLLCAVSPALAQGGVSDKRAVSPSAMAGKVNLPSPQVKVGQLPMPGEKTTDIKGQYGQQKKKMVYDHKPDGDGPFYGADLPGRLFNNAPSHY